MNQKKYIKELEERIDVLEAQLSNNMRYFSIPTKGQKLILTDDLHMNHDTLLTRNNKLIKCIICSPDISYKIYQEKFPLPIRSAIIKNFISYTIPKGTRLQVSSYDIKDRKKGNECYDVAKFDIVHMDGLNVLYKVLKLNLTLDDVLRMNALAVDDFED